MFNRRELLQGAIVASLLPMIVRASAIPTTIYKFIYDERFAEGRSFGREAARLGLSTHAIAGDMTSVWFHELYPRWKRGPVAIAGLTAHGPLFCLERLAWDFGMRVVHRKHLPDEAVDSAGAEPQCLISWLIAPKGNPT